MKEQFRLDRQLCFRLYTASRLVTQTYNPLLADMGLTYPQYLVLLVLWEKDGQPVCDIARRLYLETNTITPLLQRMEKSGLLTRRRDSGDARKTLVSLTDKGRELQNSLEQVPQSVGNAVICRNFTQENAQDLMLSLDGIIGHLAAE